MSEKPADSGIDFWEHVRQALREYVREGKRRPGIGSGTEIRTQAQLAVALGLKPQTLSNFLSQKKTNKSLGGWAIAKACALGIELECDHHRIGPVNGRGAWTKQESEDDRQLVLEFSEDFELVHNTTKLTVQFRKGPETATSAEPTIRLRLG